MKRLLVSVSLILNLSASSVSFAEGYITFGIGNHSCGKYVENFKKDASIDRGLYGIWLSGYLTRFSRDNRVDQVKTDIDGMERWLLNYCKQNPLKNVAYASAMLIRHLEEQGLVEYLP